LKAIVFGAGTGLGKALSRQLAQQSYDLTVSSRSIADLERLAQDLKNRYSVSVQTVIVNSQSADLPQWDLDFERAYICIGGALQSDVGPGDEDSLKQLIEQNFNLPVRLMQDLIAKQKSLKQIVVISSVAAGVPRDKNAIYAAAKSALESYCTSLRVFAFQNQSQWNLLTVKLGYMESQWTDGQKLKMPAEKPDKIAQKIIKNTGSGMIFLPWRFGLVHCLLVWMPWFLYKRLRF
jgi:short-subunit dehydrogenase